MEQEGAAQVEELKWLVDVRSAAKRMGLSRWTVYLWARTGKLPSVRLGRRRLFRVADLEEFIASRREPGMPEAL